MTRHRAVATVGALAACAATIAVLVPRGPDAGTRGWSADLYRHVDAAATGMPGWLAAACSALAPLGLAALFGLAVWAAWRAWHDRTPARARVPAVIAGVVVAVATGEVVKACVREQRPCRALTGILPRAGCPAPGHWSFPSSHACVAAALAAAVLLLSGRPRWLAVTVALAVGVTRVAVGYHYPDDVLAGFLIGAAGTVATVAALRQPRAGTNRPS